MLKKITLVKFKCDLHSVNWSDKTIDFYWAQHKEVGENAIPVEGSLRVDVQDWLKDRNYLFDFIVGYSLRGRKNQRKRKERNE